jgi:photosystem II stability/assembly factor-like uncharacterized protein
LRKPSLVPVPAILVILCSGLAEVVSAGVSTWTTSGPEGGLIRALAVDPATPATLYASTSFGGVFKSTDGGERWTNTGLAAKPVFALAIDRSAPSALYAGTGDGGVFHSLDAGGGWTAINTGLTNTDVRALAIDPASPAATLHAGTNGGGVFDCRCDMAPRVPATPRPDEPRL